MLCPITQASATDTSLLPPVIQKGYAFLSPIFYQYPQVVMRDAVLCVDGQTYERSPTMAWMAGNSTSPLSGGRLQNRDLTPNFALRRR